MYSVLIGLLLLAQAPVVPDVGQRVVAELRNGYRIEGVLIEKDRRSAVLSLESGELRLDLKRVRQFHVPGVVAVTGEEPAPRGHEMSLPVPSTQGGERRLSLAVPETWARVDDDTEALTYVDPRAEIRFRIEESTESQSLWRITARLRREHKATLPGFDVKQERFGNRWADTRTWEIDFEHTEGGQRFRERHLYLDFGAAKRVFIFRTPASSFAALIGHFERITSGMTLESSAGPAKSGTPGAGAEPDARAGGNSTTDRSQPVRLEDIEQALEAEIRRALEGELEGSAAEG